MIIAQIIGVEAVQSRFVLAASTSRKRVEVEVKRLGIELLNKVKADKLSGQVLNVKTGKLRRSMNMKFENSQDGMSASVGTNTVYARIHEFGGKIFPKNGKALKFTWPGHAGNFIDYKAVGKALLKGGAARSANKAISIGDVHMLKCVNMPMRSFLRSALEEMRTVIQERLLACVRGLI